MKKVLFLIAAVVSMSTAFSQQKATAKSKVTKTTTTVSAPPAAQSGNSLTFTESKFSFGKIKQGVPVTHVFSFKNTSSGPVFIENATAQCGCTTPDYPKGAIAKGATEKIKVTYNAAAMGSFTKQVTVRVAKQANPIILTIDGEVVPNEDKKG